MRRADHHLDTAGLASVHNRAEQFRRLLRRLAEPGGLTRRRLGELAAWLDGPAWRLLDDHDRCLQQIQVSARGQDRSARQQGPAPTPR